MENNTNGGFFEVKKSELQEFDEFAKGAKVRMIIRDIIAGVIIIPVSTTLIIQGANPFLAVGMFGAPLALLVGAQIKQLAMMKKDRQRIADKEEGQGRGM